MGRDLLIGEDGGLFLVTEGTEKTGDGSKKFDELAGGADGSGKGKGWWKITAKAAASPVFGTKLAIGDLFYTDGTAVAKTGDKAKQLTGAEIANVVAWSAEVSRNEIEMTTLNDHVKRYVYGKADWSGTIEGILSQSQTALVKRFVDIYQISSSGSATIVRRSQTSVDFLGYLQKHTEGGLLEQFLYLPSIELGGFSFGATDGSRQEFSCPWRFGIEAEGTPQMYTRAVS